MKNILFILAALFFYQASAQDMKNFNLYNPYANVDSAIKVAVLQAAKENKHVFLQMGGNWCVWCARFNEFTNKDMQLDSAMKANYIVVHVNYSKENSNKAIMEKYNYPMRFGFPVFVLLDTKGSLIHTQNSSYLEAAKGYDKAKVLEFFDSWGPGAFSPAKYNWLK